MARSDRNYSKFNDMNDTWDNYDIDKVLQPNTHGAEVVAPPGSQEPSTEADIVDAFANSRAFEALRSSNALADNTGRRLVAMQSGHADRRNPINPNILPITPRTLAPTDYFLGNMEYEHREKKSTTYTDRLGVKHDVYHSVMPPPNKDYSVLAKPTSNRRLEKANGINPRGHQKKSEVKGVINPQDYYGGERELVSAQRANVLEMNSRDAILNQTHVQPSPSIEWERDGMYDGHNFKHPHSSRTKPLQHCWRNQQTVAQTTRQDPVTVKDPLRDNVSTGRAEISEPFQHKPVRQPNPGHKPDSHRSLPFLAEATLRAQANNRKSIAHSIVSTFKLQADDTQGKDKPNLKPQEPSRPARLRTAHISACLVTAATRGQHDDDLIDGIESTVEFAAPQAYIENRVLHRENDISIPVATREWDHVRRIIAETEHTQEDDLELAEISGRMQIINNTTAVRENMDHVQGQDKATEISGRMQIINDTTTVRENMDHVQGQDKATEISDRMQIMNDTTTVRGNMDHVQGQDKATEISDRMQIMNDTSTVRGNMDHVQGQDKTTRQRKTDHAPVYTAIVAANIENPLCGDSLERDVLPLSLRTNEQPVRSEHVVNGTDAVRVSKSKDASHYHDVGSTRAQHNLSTCDSKGVDIKGRGDITLPLHTGESTVTLKRDGEKLVKTLPPSETAVEAASSRTTINLQRDSDVYVSEQRRYNYAVEGSIPQSAVAMYKDDEKCVDLHDRIESNTHSQKTRSRVTVNRQGELELNDVAATDKLCEQINLLQTPTQDLNSTQREIEHHSNSIEALHYLKAASVDISSSTMTLPTISTKDTAITQRIPVSHTSSEHVVAHQGAYSSTCDGERSKRCQLQAMHKPRSGIKLLQNGHTLPSVEKERGQRSQLCNIPIPSGQCESMSESLILLSKCDTRSTTRSHQYGPQSLSKQYSGALNTTSMRSNLQPSSMNSGTEKINRIELKTSKVGRYTEDRITAQTTLSNDRSIPSRPSSRQLSTPVRMTPTAQLESSRGTYQQQFSPRK